MGQLSMLMATCKYASPNFSGFKSSQRSCSSCTGKPQALFSTQWSHELTSSPETLSASCAATSRTALRVIGRLVARQKACYIIAVPLAARADLATHSGRNHEEKLVLSCLIPCEVRQHH